MYGAPTAWPASVIGSSACFFDGRPRFFAIFFFVGSLPEPRLVLWGPPKGYWSRSTKSLKIQTHAQSNFQQRRVPGPIVNIICGKRKASKEVRGTDLPQAFAVGLSRVAKRLSFQEESQSSPALFSPAAPCRTRAPSSMSTARQRFGPGLSPIGTRAGNAPSIMRDPSAPSYLSTLAAFSGKRQNAPLSSHASSRGDCL